MTRCFLPEWEHQEGILMALPDEHTDWDYILDEARDQYHRIIKTFTAEGCRVFLLCRDRKGAMQLLSDCDSSLISFIEAEYNDTWTRDYGPLAVKKDERLYSLDFGFNGWGLKFAADKDNLVNLFLADSRILSEGSYRNNRDFVLEGGSVETDGRGTLLATSRCLCSPNRNGQKSKEALNDILGERLGVNHILWLDYGALEGDDTDSHIDTLARLAPCDTILFTGCRDVDDPQFEDLLKMRAQLTLFRTAEGDPFNLVELPLPSPVLSPEGERLPATYANFLVTDSVVFMPTYAQPENDLLAMQMVKVAYPDHKVVGIECLTLLRQHGSLHCATMQLYPGQTDTQTV